MTTKERRIVPRRPVLMMGVIIFSEKAPRIQCKVTDISEIGAGLEISTTVNIPQEFYLVVEGIRRRCPHPALRRPADRADFLATSFTGFLAEIGKSISFWPWIRLRCLSAGCSDFTLRRSASMRLMTLVGSR